MGIAFIPLYINYLGIESYGLIGIFALLQAWLRLMDMGMTPTLGREMARFTGGGRTAESIRDLLRTIEIIAVGIALFMASAVALSSSWIATSWLKAHALPTAVVAQAFAIMGLVTALRFLEGVYRSAIQGLQRQVLFNMINIVMATLRWGGAVAVLAWVSQSIGAFFVWQGIVSFLNLVILATTTYLAIPHGKRPSIFSIPELRSICRFAGGIMGISFLAVLLTQADKILLSKLLSLSDFGYYSLAATVAGSLTILAGPITCAFYPRYCELHTRGDTVEFANSFHKGAQMISAVVGSAAAVLIVNSKIFLTVWSQDQTLAAKSANVLSLLAIGTLLNTLMWIPYQAQLAHRWTRLGIQTNIMAVVLIVPAIIWVVPRYAAEGAALVWLVLNAGYVLVTAQLMFRKILPNEKWCWYKKDVLTPLMSAGGAVIFVKLILPVPEKPAEKICLLIISSIVAIVSSTISCNYLRSQIGIYIKSWLMKLGFLINNTRRF